MGLLQFTTSAIWSRCNALPAHRGFKILAHIGIYFCVRRGAIHFSTVLSETILKKLCDQMFSCFMRNSIYSCEYGANSARRKLNKTMTSILINDNDLEGDLSGLASTPLMRVGIHNNPKLCGMVPATVRYAHGYNPEGTRLGQPC